MDGWIGSSELVMVGVRVEKGGLVECRCRICRGEAQGGLSGWGGEGDDRWHFLFPVSFSFPFSLLDPMIPFSTYDAHPALDHLKKPLTLSDFFQ